MRRPRASGSHTDQTRGRRADDARTTRDRRADDANARGDVNARGLERAREGG